MTSDVFVSLLLSLLYTRPRLYGLVSLFFVFCSLELYLEVDWGLGWTWIHLVHFALLSVTEGHCQLRPFLNKIPHWGYLGDTTWIWTADPHEGLWLQRLREFFPPYTPSQHQSHTGHFSYHPFCTKSLSFTLILGVWWCSDPKFMQGLLRFHVWCPQLFLLTPSHQQHSERVLMVTKTQALGGELLWCFLASQGPLSTLILDLCSSPLRPCYNPLYGAASHEERRKDRKPPPGYPHQLNMGD